jgi:hypothetical protein
MDRIQEQLNRPLVAAALGFILGLIIGLPVLGWGLFPVEWTDASVEHLREDLKLDYLRMSVDSYARNQDAQLALQRWDELGSGASDLLAQLQLDPRLNPQDVSAFTTLVASGATLPGPVATSAAPTTAMGTALPGVTPTRAATSEAAPTSPLVLLGVFCLLTLVIGGALVYVLVLRRRGGEGGGGLFKSVRQPQESGSRQAAHTPEYTPVGQDPPVAPFVTTYVGGDDLYDDSFSIDSPSGEFLGECGVGISETIGVGDPKKVTAFEVWLFDKNDIQTVTKVLMSEHAFNDANTNQRLASKGEPVLVEPGGHVILETATLQVEARVVDMNYGQGALPAGSFFDRMTLELSVWQKTSA